MSVPAITIYSSPHHSCQIGSCHVSLDFELSGARASATVSSPSPPPSSVAAQKVGGLSCIFSSASATPAAVHPSPSPSFTSNDEHGSFRKDRRDELGTSFSYSLRMSAPSKRREESPVSVFRGPVSRSGICSSKSPPLVRSPREWSGGDWRTGRDRLFKGFVRCALNSCLDYSSSSFSMPTASGDLLVEELSFGLEEEEACEPFAKKILAEAQARHKVFYEEVVVEAFYEAAEKAHRGQMRASGDPYLHHCVETAILLARIGAHATVVAAGLLHDTLDDSFIDYDLIFRKFGAGVADLVEGVSKLSHLSQLARDNDTASKTIEADRLHTMFLAMADARAVLIKLADRLHNMMTLEALSVEKQQRFANETLEIFVPLACRLGISSWKDTLENLCFKYLYPEEQRSLSLLLLKSFNEALVSSAIHKLGKALVDEGINHALSGRDKSLYSIYSKMLKKNLNMEQIHDIHGIRLIVENEDDCYKALDIVHRVWPKLLGRFKDYIRYPKFNGYQSLHTVVVSEDMLPLEVQIRTKEMHQQAEYGIAAHWKYKEDDCKHTSFVLQMVEWARWVLSWQCETMKSDYSESFEDRNLTKPACSFPTHSDDCPYSYAQNCAHNGPIFVVMLENQNMSVLEFPIKSTVMDLMERVSGGGSRLAPCDFPVKLELRPKLNRELVANLNQKLKMGDVIELTPALPDKSLTEYRQDFQRMYEKD